MYWYVVHICFGHKSLLNTTFNYEAAPIFPLICSAVRSGRCSTVCLCVYVNFILMHTTTRPHVYRSLPSTSPSRSPLIKVFFLYMSFGPQLGDLWILWTFKIALYALRDIATNYFPSVAEIIERASRKHKTPYVQSDICMQSIHNNYSLFIVYNTPCSTSTSTSPFFFFLLLSLSLPLTLHFHLFLSISTFLQYIIYLFICLCVRRKCYCKM